MNKQEQHSIRKAPGKGFRGDTSFEQGLDGAMDSREELDDDKLNNIDESQPSEEQEEPKPQRVRKPSLLAKWGHSILSGSILSKEEVQKRYPYMLFIALLMLMYIANVFKMQQLYRTEASLSKQVKELRAKSLTLSSRRMDITRQSKIIKEVEDRELGLRESLSPPKVIEK